MIRDLKKSNFLECRTFLSKQISPLTNITNNITSAIVLESETEFNNEFMKTQYRELSNLMNERRNSIIEHQITLSKKQAYLYKDDNDAALKLDSLLDDIKSSCDSINNMKNSIISCLPTLTENDFSVDKLIDILPEDRANQIKDGNLFISSDYKYLYYKGYAYEIYDPYLERNNTTTLSFSRIEEWTIVHTKSYDETTWDWWGAVANLSNMSSDDYAGAMVDNYSNTFNIIDALIGVAKFIEDARNDASVDVVFEQNQYGDRRVVIGITNSTYQEIYNNYAGTSMSVLDNCMDNAAKWRWSKEISNYYSYLTGKTVDMLKYDYDLVITMDEGHRNQKYTSTVSFDEDGTMIESTLILPNDSIKIIQQGSFLGLNEKEIYNVNIKECEEISEQYKTMFLQGLNYGFD